jgi:uncharacterized protein (TIGR02246 family)
VSLPPLVRVLTRTAAVASVIALGAPAALLTARDFRLDGRVAMYPGAPQAGDSAAVARVVEAYDRALAAGDSAAALALLAPDATVLESGDAETRADYREHHLPADMAFARAVRGTRSPIRVVVRGDAAWATSTSTTQGSFRGRPVNSSGAELMVLTREPGGWRIRAIHWSSRAMRPR